MVIQRIIVLLFLTFLFVLCVKAQYTAIEVFVYDRYTETPLDAALVSIIHDGEVIDSAYTDTNGRANLLTITNVREPEGLPTSLSLSHNYPNPFSEETNVELGIPESQTIRAGIYTILGQRIFSEHMNVSSGYYTLNISLGHLPIGVYILRIEGRESQAVKLIKMEGGIHHSVPQVTISQIGIKEKMIIGKNTSDQQLLKVMKDRYADYEKTIVVTESVEIKAPLERMNMIEFVVVGGDANPVPLTLDIKGDTFQTTITTPESIILKSGLYEVTGEIQAGVYLERNVEIPSVDSTIVLSYLTDIDDNIYRTVKIGDRWWMAENLKVSRYRNRVAIPTGLDSTAWADADYGAYAIYPHTGFGYISSDAEVVKYYGKLYNWYAAVSEYGLCPEGWHVPTDEEWMQLEMYVGMSEAEAGKAGWRGTNEGGKLKSPRTATFPPSWGWPNMGATDEYGWSGFPGGQRQSIFVAYAGSQMYGFWWSSTGSGNTNYARSRTLYLTSTQIGRNIKFKQFGKSIRCVMD